MKPAIFICCPLPARFLTLLFFLLTAFSLQAQLCQGSLGDPIVNITFGSGSNPGPSLAAVQGSQYQMADCPNDGFYSVRNSTVSCYSNTWHTITTDHTGDANGYFMLINASFQPSVFYLDTVKNLCGATTYEFAAWLMNVQKSIACNGNIILPNVTFSIEKTDGTVLQSYSTGNLPATPFPTWKQNGFFFATPSGVSDVVLRIVNNAPGGCGNDIALDDITFRPCGAQISAAITGASSDTLNYCEGSAHSFSLSATVSGSMGTAAYQWQRRFNGGSWGDITGATNVVFNSTLAATANAGLYEYRIGTADAANINSARCRTYSKLLSIVIHANPQVVITASGQACSGKSFLLKASGANSYNWSGPNNFSSSDSTLFFPAIQTTQNGVYSVVATSSYGCTSSTSYTITVAPSTTAAVSFTDTTVCAGMVLSVSASGGSSYLWLPGTYLSNNRIANPTFTAVDSIQYRVVVSNTFNCNDTATVSMNVIKKAIANAGADKVILAGMQTTLDGSIRNAYTQFYWTPATTMSNPQSLQPTVSPGSDIAYVLTAVSQRSCGVSTDTVVVKVYKDIFIPTAFTPNGDGVNDVWKIAGLQAFPNFNLTIFNRWGQTVFHSINPNQFWDGKLNGVRLPAGAYVYYLSIPGIPKNFRGTVMIVQ